MKRRKVRISIPTYPNGGGSNSNLNWGPSNKTERKKLLSDVGNPPDMIITLKDDKDYIDGISNWAAVSGADRVNINFNDQIKQGLYSGKYGYNPSTGQLINLAKANAADKQTTLPESEKKYLEKREDVPYEQAIAEWNKDRVPVQIERGETSWNPSFEFQGLGRTLNTQDFGGGTVYMTQKEADDYLQAQLLSSMEATQRNPLWYAPGMIYTAGAAPALDMLIGAGSAVGPLSEGKYGEAALTAGLGALPFTISKAGTIAKQVDKAIYPKRTWRASSTIGENIDYAADLRTQELAEKIAKQGEFTTSDLGELEFYLRGNTGRKGLLMGDDMTLTEYKVPFWKRNVSENPDVVSLKELQGSPVNKSEYIIPSGGLSKFLYPRKTTLLKGAPEHLTKVDDWDLKGTIPLSYESPMYYTNFAKYLEDQMNAAITPNVSFAKDIPSKTQQAENVSKFLSDRSKNAVKNLSDNEVEGINSYMQNLRDEIALIDEHLPALRKAQSKIKFEPKLVGSKTVQQSYIDAGRSGKVFTKIDEDYLQKTKSELTERLESLESKIKKGEGPHRRFYTGLEFDESGFLKNIPDEIYHGSESGAPVTLDYLQLDRTKLPSDQLRDFTESSIDKDFGFFAARRLSEGRNSGLKYSNFRNVLNEVTRNPDISLPESMWSFMSNVNLSKDSKILNVESDLAKKIAKEFDILDYGTTSGRTRVTEDIAKKIKDKYGVDGFYDKMHDEFLILSKESISDIKERPFKVYDYADPLRSDLATLQKLRQDLDYNLTLYGMNQLDELSEFNRKAIAGHYVENLIGSKFHDIDKRLPLGFVPSEQIAYKDLFTKDWQDKFMATNPNYLKKYGGLFRYPHGGFHAEDLRNTALSQNLNKYQSSTAPKKRKSLAEISLERAAENQARIAQTVEKGETAQNVAQTYIGGADLETISNQAEANRKETEMMKEAVAQHYAANNNIDIDKARETVNKPSTTSFLGNLIGIEGDLGGFDWSSYYKQKGLGLREVDAMRGLTDEQYEDLYGQSWYSRTYDVLSNPLDAFKYSVTTGDFRNMPKNYSDYEYALSQTGESDSYGVDWNPVASALEAAYWVNPQGWVGMYKGIKNLPSNIRKASTKIDEVLGSAINKARSLSTSTDSKQAFAKVIREANRNLQKGMGIKKEEDLAIRLVQHPKRSGIVNVEINAHQFAKAVKNKPEYKHLNISSGQLKPNEWYQIGDMDFSLPGVLDKTPRKLSEMISKKGLKKPQFTTAGKGTSDKMVFGVRGDYPYSELGYSTDRGLNQLFLPLTGGKGVPSSGLSAEVRSAINQAAKSRGYKVTSGGTGHEDYGAMRYIRDMLQGRVEPITDASFFATRKSDYATQGQSFSNLMNRIKSNPFKLRALEKELKEARDIIKFGESANLQSGKFREQLPTLTKLAREMQPVVFELKKYGGLFNYEHGGDHTEPKGLTLGSSKPFRIGFALGDKKWEAFDPNLQFREPEFRPTYSKNLPFEKRVDAYLGFPMKKAYKAAELFAEDGDPVDNYRHSVSGMYTAQALKNRGMSTGASIVASNLAGLGHEIATAFRPENMIKDTRSWKSKLIESGEDMVNNAIGSLLSPVNPKLGEAILKYMSMNNMMPDGVVIPENKEGITRDMYFNKE